MAHFDSFRHEVESALENLMGEGTLTTENVHHLLNGAAADALDNFFSRSERVDDGIFFSGRKLSQHVASRLKEKIEAGATIADPTCGAGDLLLGCLALAPIRENLADTVSQWSKRVVGLDIHPEFVATTKARLALLAAERHRSKTPGSCITPTVSDSFSGVRHVDFFSAVDAISNTDCVVMNPPFYDAEAPEDCSWAAGKTQIAARFVECVLVHAKASQEIVAVLPDVLRSGTRYGKWRSQIAQRAEILDMHVYGRFDKKTDVDVFVIHLRKLESQPALDCVSTVDWSWKDASLVENVVIPKLQDYFHVSVGAVVPHRHKNLGQWFPYLSVPTALPNREITVVGKKRTTGSVHQAPFIAIRRTSSPGDPKRIVATIVLGEENVAVENHLIVIRPLDASIQTCRDLIKILANQSTEDWINQVIRCRHLTTTAVKRLPLIGWKK